MQVFFGNQVLYEGKRINKSVLWKHFVDDSVENMYSEMEDRYFFHNAASSFKKYSIKIPI